MFARVALPRPVDRLFDYSVPEGLDQAARPGARVEVPLGRLVVRGWIVERVGGSEWPVVQPIRRVLDEPPLPQEFLDLGRWLADTTLCSIGEGLQALSPPLLTMRARVVPSPLQGRGEGEGSPLQLTPDQSRALDLILPWVRTGSFHSVLLHGVTASGKTEVYLRAIQAALEAGRSAIYLVPEIALTPQFLSLCRARFGARVGLWHSRLAAGERARVWRGARDGTIEIMLGPRSAVFAPLARLGVIVVDEEHDSAYRQDQKPMYDAVEAALWRGRRHGAVVILGSATPSMARYRDASEGRLALVRMPSRVDGRALPAVRVVNLSQEPLVRRGRNLLSGALRDEIQACLSKHQQVILLLNRRGYSTWHECLSCGEGLRCRRCLVAMVLHQAEGRLRCHYCGASSPIPSACPACGGPLRPGGAGTERVVSEVRAAAPGARIQRLDLDAVRRRGEAGRIFQAMHQGEIDILVGTQMVAKGFDFPDVTLVGVVNADTALHLPDFRSAERTFTLAAQVSGRAGRGREPGRVIIQTYQPRQYSLLAAARHDYEGFYSEEAKFRQEANYPPFTFLARVLCLARDARIAEAGATAVAVSLSPQALVGAVALRPGDRPAVEVLGPSPAIRSVIGGRHRWQVLLKGERSAVLATIRSSRPLWSRKGGLQVRVEVDPDNLL